MITGRCGLVCSDCIGFLNESCKGCDEMNISDPRFVNTPCSIWICALAREVSLCEVECQDYPCPTYNHKVRNCPWLKLMMET